MTTVGLGWVFLSLMVGATATVIYARVLGSEDETNTSRRLRQAGTTDNVVHNLCTDCRKKANVPACSYICNLNAINVTHPELERISGLFFARPDTVANRKVRWVLGLQAHTHGKIEGFSTAQIGSHYQDYDINGLYIGDETLLLILRTTFDASTNSPSSSNTAVVQEASDDNHTGYPLDRSEDPEAIGLKLRIVNFDLLHAQTTGYTYVDPQGPFELIFERKTRSDLDTYFELTA